MRYLLLAFLLTSCIRFDSFDDVEIGECLQYLTLNSRLSTMWVTVDNDGKYLKLAVLPKGQRSDPLGFITSKLYHEDLTVLVNTYNEYWYRSKCNP